MSEIDQPQDAYIRLLRLSEVLMRKNTILLNALNRIGNLPEENGKVSKEEIKAIIIATVDKISYP